MEMIRYFFECYFNESFDFDELEDLINKYKKVELDVYKTKIVQELHQIIQINGYKVAAKIIKKYGGRIIPLDITEKLIKYLYNKFTDQPAYLDRKDFVKDCVVIFCPVCTPRPEVALFLNNIKKATIIGNNMQIYMCIPCKLVWTNPDDIKKENAQVYKKFMKQFGLKGLMRELKDIDDY
jgi:hypothetical protein